MAGQFVSLAYVVLLRKSIPQRATYKLPLCLALGYKMTLLYLLAAMFFAHVVLSIILKRKQRELELLPAKETSHAIWVGIFWINVPIVPILLAPIFVQQKLFSNNDTFLSVLCLFFGFVIAWFWWSINVSLWRRWALRKGVDPDELQREGESSSILWSQGHYFERTEFENIIKWLRK